jgi:hypothetical protein
MNELRLGVMAVILLAASGCGSSVVAGTGGNNNGTGGNGSGASPCPAAEPSAGNVPCTGVPEGFRCTYGDSVRPECRHDWTCSGGTWLTTKSFCQDPPPDACAPAEPQNGVDCTASNGATCTYGDDICTCSLCPGGPCMQNPTWVCSKPPTNPGCPPVVPNDGTACDAPAADCTYGMPCGGSGMHVTCKNGTWLWDLNMECPL